jgi:hypothetical protein
MSSSFWAGLVSFSSGKLGALNLCEGVLARSSSGIAGAPINESESRARDTVARVPTVADRLGGMTFAHYN